MAIKKHNISWASIFKGGTSTWYGKDHPLKCDTPGQLYNTLMGMNSVAILNDIKNSSTTVKVWLNVYVTTAGRIQLGMHKTTNYTTATGLFYAWTGRGILPSTGWLRWDITTFARQISGGHTTFKAALENGYHGLVLHDGDNPFVADGVGTTNYPYIEIEGTWNTPPSTTNFTKPIADQTFDKVVPLEWTQATDAEQDNANLTYFVTYYDGVEWKNEIAMGRRLSYDFPDIATVRETSKGRFCIRVFDGELYSGYTYSNYITVNHNTPPNTPTLTYPVGGAIVNRKQATIFKWQHNDDDAQSKYKISWRTKGVGTWTTSAAILTSVQSHTYPAYTFPVGEIEWQVQTYDQGDLASPWSASGIFRSTEAGPAPIIISPISGETLTTADFFMQWTSANQFGYRVVLQKDGVSVYDWTGGKSKVLSKLAVLENESEYLATMTVADEFGVTTPWSDVTFNTSFYPPQQPNITITTEDASIKIRILNPLAVGDEPDVIKNIIERREDGGEWIRLVDDVGLSGEFIDYTPASGVVYEYGIIAVGENGTYSPQTVQIGSISFSDSILSLASDPTKSIILKWNPDKSFSTDYNARKMVFAGRGKAVTEFSELTELDGSLSFMMLRADLQKFKELASRKETLLFRDSRQKRVYGIISGQDVKDYPRRLEYYDVSFNFQEVDFKEGVEND